MKSWNLLTVASLSMVIAFSVACSNKKENKGSPRDTYVVVGDPLKLIEGARLSPEIDTSFFDVKSVRLLARQFYAAKVEVQKKLSDAEILKKNAPPADDSDFQGDEMYVRRNQDGWLALYEARKASLESAYLWLPPNQDIREAHKKPFDPEAHQTRVLHFSRSQDGRFASLLIYFNNAKLGPRVVAFYFSRDVKWTEPPKGKMDYFYVSGRGVQFIWKPPVVDIQICGPHGRKIKNDVLTAVEKWNVALEGRLRLKVTEKAEAPPFSDLRVNCIVPVGTFLVGTGNPPSGRTLNIPDVENHSFVQSHIFIFESILIRTFGKHDLENRSASLQTYVSYVVTHELGHLLGLDHQFEGVPSVMSYQDDIVDLQHYDIEAIQALYPLQQSRVFGKNRSSMGR